MSKVVPTVLTNSQEEFEKTLAVYSTFAKRIQIDVCDGKFVPLPTVSEKEMALIHPENILYDLHMMVQTPSAHLDAILNLKPYLCIFHAECGENLLPIFEKLKQNGIKAGVAILKTTFPGKIKPYIEAADHALVFAGQLGKQGGNADLMQIEKIPLIRAIKSDIEIGWDGGANMENARILSHSDIDIINVGSAISSTSDQAKAYEQLDLEINKNGVVL